ncbi:MAG: hypothetical protein HY868_26190 [Chloroflexi bacterium]|nr:hypothetical protein [Chloroflexota bacterium]
MLDDFIFLFSRGVRIQVYPQLQVGRNDLWRRVYFFRPNAKPIVGKLNQSATIKELAELLAQIRRVYFVLS